MNDTFQLKNQSDGNGKAFVASSDNSNGDCLAVFSACASRDDEWILDTNASLQICCNKNWFKLYEFVQTKDFVHVRDDTPCHIVGVGSIQIRTHDRMTC
jgi:hypothetical protein